MTSRANNLSHGSPIIVQQQPLHMGTGLSALISAIVGLASLLFLPWQAALAAGGVVFLLTRFVSCCRGGDLQPRQLQNQQDQILQQQTYQQTYWSPRWRPRQDVVYVLPQHQPSYDIRVVTSTPSTPSYLIQMPTQRRRPHVNMVPVQPTSFQNMHSRPRTVVGGGHHIYPAHSSITAHGNRVVVNGGHFQTQ